MEKTNITFHAVVLAGGGGTRLWPLSRENYPKQFLKLLGEHSLLQETVLRVGRLVPEERVWIVTARTQEPAVREQLSSITGCEREMFHVLSEPLPRNTAAAIGLAAVHLLQQDPEAVMAVLPADHWITKRDRFLELLSSAVERAQEGDLSTLGIIPDRPETGYGFILRGEPTRKHQQPYDEAYRVKRFVEKPDLETAKHYLTRRDYYWNAGIFVWRATTILEEIASFLPELHSQLEEIRQSLNGNSYEETLSAVYPQMDSVSIDYGVLEKSSRLIVVPADIGWSDLGEWSTIHHLSPQDDQGNTLGDNVLNIDSRNTFVYSNRPVIAAIGLEDMVVVDTDDALLICPQKRTQDVRAIVHQLKSRNGHLTAHALTEHRPWGFYTVLQEGKQHQVKRIVVNPGASLSLQLHHHRSEHWVIVSGVAKVINGDQEFLLRTGRSTYIPVTTKHRLSNPGTEPLEIIEIQTGSYLGEDDIERFDDLYGRA